MGVQAGGPGSFPEPAPTAAVPVVPVVSNSGQGVLFHEAHGYATFGDTDEIPVVTETPGRNRGRGRAPGHDRGRRRRRGGPRAPRWLRIAVVVVTLVILAAAAVLGLVKAGIIDGNGKGGNQAATGTSASAHQGTNPKETKSLLTAAGTTASGAVNYTIRQHVYRVTVTTSVGRSWVVIGAVDQQPAFAGIVPAFSSQHEIILGPGQVQVGAGGTKVTVSSGRHSQTLIPPSAPFSYQITPA
jgi:hypothetical protein